jgi:hypothetical protein
VELVESIALLDIIGPNGWRATEQREERFFSPLRKLILDQVSTKLSWLNTKFMSQYMTQSTSNSGQT